jgi:glucokinase
MSEQRVIGVDVGGTKTLAGLIDESGKVLRRVKIATPASSTEALLAGLDRVVERLLDPEVKAIGFGIPSSIDQRSGTVLGTVNLPLAGFRFRERMRDQFELPVGIDNDANVAAIAEWRAGAGRGANDLVMVTLGTGVGGGLILGGKPYRGSVGAGAELGHMVVLKDGPPCYGNCSGHGHLEALASGYAASRMAREELGPGTDARKLVDLALCGDERALTLLQRIGEMLGAAFGSFVNIFNPELIVVGGGFAAAGDLILAPARERMANESLPGLVGLTRVVLAELGPDAGMIGAGFVAFEALEQAAFEQVE